jgi:hypothetical protein
MTQPDGPTDEQLQRLNLTRERWEAIQAALRVREARAPRVGGHALDFDLPLLSDRARSVRLSSFHGKRPVALIFGSYT